MKKVVYNVTRYRKDELIKISGLGYITDEDLIIACISQNGKPYIRVFQDCIKDCHPTGGYLIYGYKVENKKILIDEDKAEIVRQIFDKFLQGVPVLEIIRDLKERGVMNRGRPFARNTVHRLLRNEKYTGVYRYGEEVFENIYPAIISKETYERAMEKSAVREYGKRSTEVIYYLRNKLKCGYCGHPITGETGTARNGSIKRYYKCSGRKHHNGCQKATVKKDQIEDMIYHNFVFL